MGADNNNDDKNMISEQLAESSEKGFKIHMVCGVPFRYVEEETALIKKIIEDELHHWPNRDELAEIAERIKLRESKTRMIVHLMRQQVGLYRMRQKFFEDEVSDGGQHSAENDQDIDFFEDD